MSKYPLLVALIGLAALAGLAYKNNYYGWTGTKYWRAENAIELTIDQRPTTAEILNANGYRAENHYISTPDGYHVNVIRANNPKISQQVAQSKRPVVLVHGKQLGSEIFVIRLSGAKPRDLSGVDLSSLDKASKLKKALDPNSPNSQTIASLLLDLGHEVWLMDRRGSPGSLRAQAEWSLEDATHVTRSFADDEPNNYWDFSLDEQAKYDLPELINYVLYVTKQPKLSLVGHSLGGAIILMTLAEYPNMADKGKS